MLRGLLYSIDPNTMLLMGLFVIFFAFINFALFKFFKNRGTSGVIAFCISAGAVYGLNWTGFDISGWFYGLGISEGTLYTIVPIIIVLGLIFLFWKLKVSRTLMLLGILLIIASFTPLIYEKAVFLILIVGIGLFVVGLVLYVVKKKREKIKESFRKQERFKREQEERLERYKRKLFRR